MCETISKDDLGFYVSIVYDLEIGHKEDAELEAKRFISKGYGTSIETISDYFRKHMEECPACEREFNEDLKFVRHLEDLLE